MALHQAELLLELSSDICALNSKEKCRALIRAIHGVVSGTGRSLWVQKFLGFVCFIHCTQWINIRGADTWRGCSGFGAFVAISAQIQRRVDTVTPVGITKILLGFTRRALMGQGLMLLLGWELTTPTAPERAFFQWISLREDQHTPKQGFLAPTCPKA